jgi:hypothetical protein
MSDMTTVSPELVLVDPVLREAALAALPMPADSLPGARQAPVAACHREPPRVEVPRPTERAPRLDRFDNQSLRAAPAELDAGRAPTAAFALLAVSGVFGFAYFLGAPVLELIEALGAALPA